MSIKPGTKAARSASATKSTAKGKPAAGARAQRAKVTFADISVIIRADHVLENLEASRLAYAHGMRSAADTIVKDLAPCKLLDAGRKSIPADARATLNRYAEAYGADTQLSAPLSQAIRARIRRLYRTALVASAHQKIVAGLDADTQLRWFMSTRTACALATDAQFMDMLSQYRSDYATFLRTGVKPRGTKGPKAGKKEGAKGSSSESATPPATPPAPGSESATPAAGSVPATPPADPREAAIKAQGEAHNKLIDALAQYIEATVRCFDLGIEPMSKTARTALEVRMRNALDTVVNPQAKPVAKGKGKKTA